MSECARCEIEKPWRHYLALEAQERGSVAHVAKAGRGRTKYDPARLARSRSRRTLQHREEATEAGGREKARGGEGCPSAGRSGTLAGTQGRSNEPAQVDEPC